MELLDRLKQAFNLVSGLVKVIRELSIDLVTAFNLGLEILDCSIDVANGSLFSIVSGLLFFEL